MSGEGATVGEYLDFLAGRISVRDFYSSCYLFLERLSYVQTSLSSQQRTFCPPLKLPHAAPIMYNTVFGS